MCILMKGFLAKETLKVIALVELKKFIEVIMEREKRNTKPSKANCRYQNLAYLADVKIW